MEGAGEMTQVSDEIVKEVIGKLKDNKDLSNEQREILNHPLIVQNVLNLIETNTILLMLASTDPQIITIIRLISIIFFEIGRQFGKAELVNETLAKMEG